MTTRTAIPPQPHPTHRVVRVPAAVRERPPAGAIRRGHQLVQLAQQVVGQVQQAAALMLLLLQLLLVLAVGLRWGGQQGCD